MSIVSARHDKVRHEWILYQTIKTGKATNRINDPTITEELLSPGNGDDDEQQPRTRRNL